MELCTKYNTLTKHLSFLDCGCGLVFVERRIRPEFEEQHEHVCADIQRASNSCGCYNQVKEHKSSFSMRE